MAHCRAPRAVRSPRRIGVGFQLDEAGLAHHSRRRQVLFVTIDIDVLDAFVGQLGQHRLQQRAAEPLAGRRRMHYRLADVGPRRIGTLRLVMGEILGATEAGEPQQPIVALGQDGTYLAVGDGSQMRTHPLLRQMVPGIRPVAQQQIGHGLDIAGFGCSQTVHIHSFKVQPPAARRATPRPLDAGSQRLDQGSSA